MTPLLVVAGALAGAPLRLLVTRLAARGGRDPALGTLLVNVAGGALLGGLLEQLGSILNIEALVNTGVVTSLLLPSDVIWRLASSLLQPRSSIRLDSPIPIAAAQAPSDTMVTYAVAYIFVLLGLAMLAFRRRDL